ncbi:MAG TPA: hypothetical protein VL123_08085, partial [Candidatus Udaeobacter sp.]|nr:hypothetical protein [Candidatus Udaeobacter sp.]
MHGDGRGVLAEALVSWLSLYGVITAFLVYWNQTTRNRLELCIMFLLECLGALLFVRGFFWISGIKFFGILTYIVAAVIPLAILLYVEALLRRHFALWSKLFVLAGTVFFLVLALWGNLHAHPLWLPVFTAYVFAMQLVLSGAIVFRDPADFAAVEDRAVAAIAVAVVMIVPFVATDLAADLGLHMVRVGSVGILIFVHAIVVAQEPRSNARRLLVANLAVIALATLLGALQAYVIGDFRAATVARAGSMFACIILLVMIHTRVHAHGQVARGPGLVRSIAAADTRTTESFLRVLDRLPMVAAYRLMRARDLAAYDFWSFAGVFRARGEKVISHNQLRRAPHGRASDAVYHAEQLEDLMEREAMTHAVLIQESPVAVLLVQIP